MRITTRLRIISTVTAAALAVLVPVLIWSFLEFNSASSDDSLADAISVGSSERTSFSGQYFLYREDRLRAQWDESNEAIGRMLRQAEAQFHSEQDRQILERLRRNIEDSADIFHRIVKNSRELTTAAGNRYIYEELDKRLFSQLLLKNVATRDMITALKGASTWRIEQTYRRLIIIVSVFAVTLAIIIILTSMHLARLINKRLAPLHDGAKIIADGDLYYRIKGSGADEFAELALSINAMTDKLQAFTAKLESEIDVRKRAEEGIRQLNIELERRVIERTAKLEAANKDLEGFAYSVSHDLRVPLRAIDGFSQLVLKQYEDKLDDEGKRLLNVVRSNTKRMGQLVDDILAFSRAGRLEIRTSEADMEALAREVWRELEPSMAGRDVRLDIKPLPKVQGDPAMLRQVWANLLGNAAKFTNLRATARIEVGGSPGLAANGEGGEFTFYVKDNGVGFDQQYVHKLFGVFQRLHGVDEFEGTGIGLAIVKRIITRHGGRVWAEGKVNEGATFYFTLTLKES